MQSLGYGNSQHHYNIETGKGLITVTPGHKQRRIPLDDWQYERGEAAPSLDAAKMIAKAFGVTLDYLAGETSDMTFDRRKVERFQDIEKLSESEKDHVFALLDAFHAKSKMQAILKKTTTPNLHRIGRCLYYIETVS